MHEENEMDFSPDLYTLQDEDGQEHVFELIDELEEGDEHYFAFIPFYEDDDEALNSEAELVLLKTEIVDGEEMLSSIDDETEYDRIGQIFLTRIAEAAEEEYEEDDE